MKEKLGVDKIIAEGRGLPGAGKKPWRPKWMLLRAINSGRISYEEAYRNSRPGKKAIKESGPRPLGSSIS